MLQYVCPGAGPARLEIEVLADRFEMFKAAAPGGLILAASCRGNGPPEVNQKR